MCTNLFYTLSFSRNFVGTGTKKPSTAKTNWQKFSKVLPYTIMMTDDDDDDDDWWLMIDN